MEEVTMKQEVTEKREAWEEVINYLGKYRKYLKDLKPDLPKFDALNLDSKKSYLVKGSSDSLNKFRTYYLLHFSRERRPYGEGKLRQYIEDETKVGVDYDLTSDVHKEILFLWQTKTAMGIGKTETWVSTEISEVISNRTYDGLVTIILTERDLPLIESSGTLEVINLGGALKRSVTGDTSSSPQATSNRSDVVSSNSCTVY